MKKKMTIEEAAVQMAALASEPVDKKVTINRERLREETDGFIKRGDWQKASLDHIVDLYEKLHEHVYLVPDGDMDSKTRYAAKQTISKFLENEFSDNLMELSDFIRWAWRREAQRERRRRESNVETGSRLIWRFLFNKSTLTDYKVYLARKRSGK